MLSKCKQINLQERDLYEGLGVVGRKILECIFKKIAINTRNWIDLAQNRDFWRAPVNAY